MAAAVRPIDVIFCQAGAIRHENYPIRRKPWNVYGQLPRQMPPAREYWLVFRSDGAGIPALEVVPDLTRMVAELLVEARRRGLNVAGIQLDVDSPTRSLAHYATFLREVRKGLPAGVQISITALLDWFRPGTTVGGVVNLVDEFVPQFYDVQGDSAAIAAPVSAAKWSPVFNRYRKRFRIGLSTFGRARLVPRASTAAFIRDLKPLDIAIDPAFQLQTSKTAAGELVLSYRAARKTRMGYTGIEPGDTVEFILSTPEAIQAAMEQARLFRGYCAGVVLFRWPAWNETLAAQPGEVLSAAGVLAQPQGKSGELRVADGGCAAVHCVDLYLANTGPLSAAPIRYRITSSAELEYFLPAERVPVRMSGAFRIELSLPPYCGRSRLFLGRAVTLKQADFRLEEER
ncbi:MAG: DUF3142 domain-containing protein [Acidobacteria bacterium]|nr:DUF3142 domain-containing protein [Acidobacteriota bacterium]